jgi:hypothetical protein
MPRCSLVKLQTLRHRSNSLWLPDKLLLRVLWALHRIRDPRLVVRAVAMRTRSKLGWTICVETEATKKTCCTLWIDVEPSHYGYMCYSAC